MLTTLDLEPSPHLRFHSVPPIFVTFHQLQARSFRQWNSENLEYPFFLAVMSWFTSLFSSNPSAASEPTSKPERILEEPAPHPQPSISQLAEAQKRSNSTETTIQPNPNRSRVIFGAGLAFFAFSLLITRRSFARRRLASNPAFYTNAPAHHEQQAAKVNGAIEAFEALNIATVNVLSVAMMTAGGAMWYLDINSMADARKMIRGGLGVDGTGRTEQQAEEDFEEWMATTLARKEQKSKVMEAVEADRARRGER